MRGSDRDGKPGGLVGQFWVEINRSTLKLHGIRWLSFARVVLERYKRLLPQGRNGVNSKRDWGSTAQSFLRHMTQGLN